mgnify:CR=1 FL=1|tara:strand:- start:5983 stop:7083 length:1101 start_codon:yes stop_codon:yes gene_type:complete
MKKTLLLSAVLAFTISSAFAQTIMYEPFNYTDQAQNATNELILTSSGFWIAGPSISGGSTTNDDIVTSPFIAELYGLPTQQNNAYQIRGGGNDPSHKFTPRTTGDVYWSALLDVQGWTTYTPGSTGKNFMSLTNDWTPPSGSISYPGTLAIKAESTTVGETQFRFGVANEFIGSGTIGSYSTSAFTVSDLATNPQSAFFVVVRYNIDTATTTLWVNPTFTGTAMTADAPTASIVGSSGGGQVSEVGGFFIRMDSNSNTPTTVIDEIRVGLTWTDVVSNTATLSISENELQAAISLYPNPAKDYISINTKNNLEISNVEIYSLLGQKVKSQRVSEDNRVDVSSLSKGMYLMKISADGNSITKKIVIE